MRYKLGFDPTSIHADFVSVYGDQAHHYSTVTMWFNHSKEGEENLEDDDRVVRPKTVTTTANIHLAWHNKSYYPRLYKETNRAGYPMLLATKTRATVFKSASKI